MSAQGADVPPRVLRFANTALAQESHELEPAPLTDAQIDDVAERADWPKSMLPAVLRAKLRDFARAILATRSQP